MFQETPYTSPEWLLAIYKEILQINNEADKLKKRYFKLVAKMREKIPEKYNKTLMLEELLNEEIDHYISISNRADGKSFNYINFFVHMALEFDIKFMLVARHYTLRQVYATLLMEITEEMGDLNPKQLFFKRTDDYIIVMYKEKTIGVITDLNNATDLKYSSAFIKKFPIMIYDEFLAIEGDYLPDEWERLKTIYQTVDRNDEIPLIGKPKIIYLGNAVNFSSPVLSNLAMFNKLERHPINTVQQYGKVCLEMHYNDKANETKNNRAFDTENDAMVTGRFKINNHNIADDDLRESILRASREFYIKLDSLYLKVIYNTFNWDILLSVESNVDDYFMCINAVDLDGKAEFVKESYYKERHYLKYVKDFYIFDNAFSKDYIVKNDLYASLNILKCVKLYESQFKLTPSEEIDVKYERNYEYQTKRSIFKKFMG